MKNKKHRKQLLALTLVGTMLLALTACGNQDNAEASQNKSDVSATEVSTMENSVAPANELDWLNTESELPIVKEGTEKTLSIYVQTTADHGKPEDSWLYKYITEALNVNLEITTFTKENKTEFLSLAFASDTLPDIIMCGGFSASDLMKYGASEGQLIDLSTYMNDTYMPNATDLFEEHPEYYDTYRDSEGHIWSLGLLQNIEERGRIPRAFINYDWLEECNLPVPTTLDEFIDTMRTFKEKGLCDYPIGGSYASTTPCEYILNAFGYLGSNGNGNNICLKNDEVVYPIYDRETFGDYLKVMNQLYEEELIHPDFYTMDSTTTSAAMAEGTGFVAQAPFVYISTYNEYWGALPLTSQWNDTPQWSVWGLSTGGIVITSACEEPELAAKFVDFWFTDDHYYKSLNGPLVEETDLHYGMVKGKYSDENLDLQYIDYDENPDAYVNQSDYLKKKIQIWSSGNFGYSDASYTDPANGYPGEPDPEQYEDPSVLRHELTDRETTWRVGLMTTAGQYTTTDLFPNAVYFDPDTSIELSNISTAVWEYANQEIAKFVTSARPLTDEELNNYFDTLESLGASEYLQAHKDYYESIR